MIFFLTPTAQFFLGLYYFNESLNFDKLMIEKNIIVNDISKIKSILFSYFTKIDKAKINAGIQYRRIFLLNSKSISLLYMTCRRLIVIENGSKRLRTSKKL